MIEKHWQSNVGNLMQHLSAMHLLWQAVPFEGAKIHLEKKIIEQTFSLQHLEGKKL